MTRNFSTTDGFNKTKPKLKGDGQNEKDKFDAIVTALQGLNIEGLELFENRDRIVIKVEDMHAEFKGAEVAAVEEDIPYREIEEGKTDRAKAYIADIHARSVPLRKPKKSKA